MSHHCHDVIRKSCNGNRDLSLCQLCRRWWHRAGRNDKLRCHQLRFSLCFQCDEDINNNDINNDDNYTITDDNIKNDGDNDINMMRLISIMIMIIHYITSLLRRYNNAIILLCVIRRTICHDYFILGTLSTPAPSLPQSGADANTAAATAHRQTEDIRVPQEEVRGVHHIHGKWSPFFTPAEQYLINTKYLSLTTVS